MFEGQNVTLVLGDGPLDCTILGIIDESGYEFYKCLLEDGSWYFAALSDVAGIKPKKTKVISIKQGCYN